MLPMRPNISCLDFLVLQSSPKVLCIWWSSFRDLENIVKVQDLWCMTTTFIWIIWWEINASSEGWLMIVEPTWGLVLPCPLFYLFLLTPLQALYWVLYIYIYIYIYFWSDTKKYVLIEVKIKRRMRGPSHKIQKLIKGECTHL